MNNGWLKLHRKLLKSDMYQDLNTKQRDVLFQCLLLANHKEKRWEWKGEIYICKPGQFVTSLNSLAKNCAKEVKVQPVRTALLKLEKWQFLTNESTKAGRLITIINWGDYQDLETTTNKQTNKQLTNSQQTANKQLTPNKNVKNVKNVKNDKKKKQKRFTPPTLSEVKDYVRDNNFSVNPDTFYKFFTEGNWIDSKGNKVQSWKQKLITWDSNSNGTGSSKPKTEPGKFTGINKKDWYEGVNDDGTF